MSGWNAIRRIDVFAEYRYCMSSLDGYSYASSAYSSYSIRKISIKQNAFGTGHPPGQMPVGD